MGDLHEQEHEPQQQRQEHVASSDVGHRVTPRKAGPAIARRSARKEGTRPLWELRGSDDTTPSPAEQRYLAELIADLWMVQVPYVRPKFAQAAIAENLRLRVTDHDA